MVAAAAVGVGYSIYLYLSQRTDERGEVSFSNPFELGPALKFGMIYAIILLISRAAQVYLGNTGVYISSIVGGLADADAITLSMANLSSGEGGLEANIAARAVVLASMSNTAAKGSIVLVSGSPMLRKALWPGFLLMLATGIGVMFLF
jgi:uncharacterized membrane protein (DUF4010 family)